MSKGAGQILILPTFLETGLVLTGLHLSENDVIFALAIAVVAAVADLRTKRIPNWLTYGGIISALAGRLVMLGWPGLKDGLEGMLLGSSVFLILFVLGGMGGGDVKLMAAVGAFAGTASIAPLLIATAVAGGVMAVVMMTLRGRILITLWNSLELARHHMTAGLQPHPVLNVRESHSMRLPFAPAIAAGVLYCLSQTFPWR